MNSGTIIILTLSIFMVSTAIGVLLFSFRKGLFGRIKQQSFIPFHDQDVGEATDQLFKEEDDQ